MLDASVAWKAPNGVTLTLYGRNLLDEVTEGYVSPLPATWGGPGATQAPLNKGRVIGISARYTY
jgi:iron complex outermembrane receptor protein